MGVVNRVISDGQAGVDRAALDVALALGISCGGWCPKGRRAEDGVIPDKYPMTETEARNYNVRTRRNVQDSDGTLVICLGTPESGTAYTLSLALKWKKPVFIIDLDTPPPIEAVLEWIRGGRIATLNVAGPREHRCPGIYETAYKNLFDILST